MQSWHLCSQYLPFRSSGGSRGAYKDVDEVIEAAEMAGISQRVARLTPIGNIRDDGRNGSTNTVDSHYRSAG